MALQFVLEDIEGDVVVVSVYNLLPDNLSQVKRIKKAGRICKQGEKVAILEPFYKVMSCTRLQAQSRDAVIITAACIPLVTHNFSFTVREL